MKLLEITKIECGGEAQVAHGAEIAHGAPAGPCLMYAEVTFASNLDEMAPGLEQKLAAEIEAWRERQQFNQEWRAAAEASGALDFLEDDPLLEDTDEEA